MENQSELFKMERKLRMISDAIREERAEYEKKILQLNEQLEKMKEKKNQMIKAENSNNNIMSGGEILHQLFTNIRLEEMKHKGDGHLKSQVLGPPLANLSKTIRNNYVVIHQLSKRIEILQENREYVKLEKIFEKQAGAESCAVPPDFHHQAKQILQFLRENPHYLANALAMMHLDVKDDRSFQHVLLKLCRVIIISLYRCAVSPSEEKRLLKLLLELCRLQIFQEYQKFQAGSVQKMKLPETFKKLFIAYVRFSSSKKYLRSVMQDTLVEILQVTPTKKRTMSDPSSETDGDVLSEHVDELLQNIINGLSHMPFGVRLIAKGIQRAGKEFGITKSETDQLIKELLFENFFALPLKDPSYYASIMGLDVSLQNLDKVAEKIVLLMDNSKNNQSVKNYLENVTSISIDDYMQSIVKENPVFSEFIITKSEFETLLDLVIDVRGQKIEVPETLRSELWNENDPLGLLLDSFVSEQRQTQTKTKYHQIHPSSLIEIRESKPYSKREPSPINDPATKEVRQKLYVLLSSVKTFVGFKGNSTLSTLENLLSCNLENQNILSALIYEVIRCLNELPDEYKQDDFKTVLDQMLHENRFRHAIETQNMNESFITWEDTHSFSESVLNLKNFLIEYITFIKIEQFNLEEWNHLKIMFVKDFVSKFRDSSCDCSVFNNIICEQCSTKNQKIQEFMQEIKEKITNFPLWKDAEENEIKMAMIQIERNLTTLLHQQIFTHLKEDVELAEDKKTITLDLEECLVPAKHHNQAPWPFAQAELKRINNYKSPYDKFLCISRAWEVISHCVSLSDSAGPDACYPIMLYVVITTNIDNLASNTNYIKQYGNLDEIEGARFLAFRSVVKVLRKTLLEKKKELTADIPEDTNMKTSGIIGKTTSIKRNLKTLFESETSKKQDSFKL